MLLSLVDPLRIPLSKLPILDLKLFGDFFLAQTFILMVQVKVGFRGTFTNLARDGGSSALLRLSVRKQQSQKEEVDFL